MVQPDLFAATPASPVYSVSEINERVKRLLEDAFGDVDVEGEISNVRAQASGHWYFTLKDAQSQLQCILFRSDAARLRFEPEQGLHVRVRGRLGLYAPQGRYQMQVRTLHPVGHGALELAFRQLKDKLQREGLFDARRKRSLPQLPRRVALVTSPTGAAVRDLVATLALRWPLLHIRIVPVAVQGESAPGEIVRALEFLGRNDVADVVILARGGGSLEDLWAFNEERVARAIAASRLPVVSAVGHETDFTIADFVADARAATPTAAAALVVPQREELRRGLTASLRRMALALRKRSDIERHRLQRSLESYGLRRPRLLIAQHLQSLDTWQERLQRALGVRLQRLATNLDAARGRLSALSPRGVLERGYVYCVDSQSGDVVTRAAATRPRQRLHLQFADGMAPARIEGAGGAGLESEA